jgi:IPT/TIG domain
MTFFKRHIGRRVAGVGVGVALLTLGLEAPAFAQLAPFTFAPASGPAGCVVVLTGTGFTNPSVTAVNFGASAATDFVIVSDTEIRAVNPGTDGFITVTKGATGETVSSTTQFDSTTGAGGCAPTITAFTPTCGTVGTTVTITGTNLLQDATGTGTLAGALTEFSPFSAAGNGVDATHTGAAESPTQLSVLVPSGAADGVIAVTTAGGQVFSTTSFDVVTDLAQCVPVGGPEHARAITLKLAKHLVAKGKVSSTEDPAFTDCVASVPVKIQRKVSGQWKTIAKTTTTDTGAYKRKIKDKPGKYRSRAVKITLESGDICLKATSPVRKHTH